MAAPATSGDGGVIDVEAVVDCTAAPDQDAGVFQSPDVSQGVSIIKTSSFYNQQATPSELVNANILCTGPKW